MLHKLECVLLASPRQSNKTAGNKRKLMQGNSAKTTVELISILHKMRYKQALRLKCKKFRTCLGGLEETQEEEEDDEEKYLCCDLGTLASSESKNRK